MSSGLPSTLRASKGDSGALLALAECRRQGLVGVGFLQQWATCDMAPDMPGSENNRNNSC